MLFPIAYSNFETSLLLTTQNVLFLKPLSKYSFTLSSSHSYSILQRILAGTCTMVHIRIRHFKITSKNAWIVARCRPYQRCSALFVYILNAIWPKIQEKIGTFYISCLAHAVRNCCTGIVLVERSLNAKKQLEAGGPIGMHSPVGRGLGYSDVVV